MKGKRFSEEQIIGILKEADAAERVNENETDSIRI
jgi:hypothetical protein